MRSNSNSNASDEAAEPSNEEYKAYERAALAAASFVEPVAQPVVVTPLTILITPPVAEITAPPHVAALQPSPIMIAAANAKSILDAAAKAQLLVNAWQAQQAQQVGTLKTKATKATKAPLTRDDVKQLMEERWASMSVRIHSLEAICETLSAKINRNYQAPRKSSATSCCRCSKTVYFNEKKQTNKKLTCQWVDMKIIKTNMKIRYQIPNVVRTMLNAYAHCKNCKDQLSNDPANAQKRWYNKMQTSAQCAICRQSAATNAMLTCKLCKVDTFQTEHATTKGVLGRLFKSIVDVAHEVKRIDIHEEYVTHETFAIDFVAIVTTMNDKKILFAMEIQATKKEDINTFPHKMLMAVKNVKPYRTFMMNFNLEDHACKYTIVEKLEILRRWVMFAIFHGSKLPTLNLWNCFWANSNPIKGSKTVGWENEYIHPFFKEPLKIEHAPDGLKTRWEFMTDPYSIRFDDKGNEGDEEDVDCDENEAGAGGSKAEKKDKHPFSNINKNVVDINVLIFGNSYKADCKKGVDEGSFMIGKLYNIDFMADITSNTQSWKHLRCKIDCAVCAKIISECPEREV
jgi:hypothetical protein